MMRGYFDPGNLEPGYRMMNFGAGRYIMMIACMLFIAAIIIVGVYFLIRFLNKQNKPDINQFNKPNSALQILDERYAKGELSDEEYLNKKNYLK